MLSRRRLSLYDLGRLAVLFAFAIWSRKITLNPAIFLPGDLLTDKARQNMVSKERNMKQEQKGFTLIELLVVIAIIGSSVRFRFLFD